MGGGEGYNRLVVKVDRIDLTSWNSVPSYCVGDGCEDPVEFSKRCTPVIKPSRDSEHK